MTPWFARVRHDLLKPALWPARDLRALLDAKKVPAQADVKALHAGLFVLRDEDGTACDARLLWARFLQSRPAHLDAGALDSFGAGLDSAMNVVGHAAAGPASTRVLEEAIEAVLALEALFNTLVASKE
jgi:hypothetical protein